jgi:hypothetical protein
MALVATIVQMRRGSARQQTAWGMSKMGEDIGGGASENQDGLACMVRHFLRCGHTAFMETKNV